MKYYVQGKRSKVIGFISNDREEAQKWLERAKKAYRDEEWVLIEE